MKLIGKLTFIALIASVGLGSIGNGQTTRSKVAASNETIEGSERENGPSGSPWFHNAQAPGQFESYGISSYSFAASDFGFAAIDGISEMEISYMQANAGFTSDGPVEFFISFDTTVSGGDYSGLSHNGTAAGLDDSQFSDSPASQSLGTGTFTEADTGDVDTYTLTLSGSLESSLVDAINNGTPFSIILGVPDGDAAVTYAGIESNNFESNGGTEPDSKRTTLSITATSDGPELTEPTIGAPVFTGITETSAIAEASFAPNSATDFTEYGFVVADNSVNSDPMPGDGDADTIDFSSRPVPNPISVEFTGLTADTEYAVRAYAIYDFGVETAVGGIAAFSTLAPVIVPGLDGVTDYTQDFSGFVSAETLPDGWSIVHAGDNDYGGDWGSGTTNGPRGNASVLGFQHTGSTETAVKTLTLENTSGAAITELFLSYEGRVERAGEGRSSEYSVAVDEVAVATLGYSTDEGDNVTKTAVVSGLSIPVGETFEITWSSERGGGSGSSKQIGISNLLVSLEIPSSIQPSVLPITFPDPIEFPVTSTGFSVDSGVQEAGSDPITDVGFVIAKTELQPNPVIGDSDTTVISLFDEFDPDFDLVFVDFEGLDPGTSYSVRFFATSDAGTTYSAPITETTLSLPAPLTGAGYSESFLTFSGLDSLPQGWSVIAEVDGFGGDWGSGSSGGFRGPGEEATEGVLGYQHTSSTGTVTIRLEMTNDTGEEITALDVSYLGRVERPDQTRLPIWTVEVDGAEVPALSYSTGAGVDETVSATITGLSIADGETFTVSWSSNRGESAGASRQIGLADVTVDAASVDVTAPVFNVPFGTYFEDQTVFISNFDSLDASVEVRYTLDGTDPATGVGSVYDDETGILVEDGSGPVELRAISVDTSDSSVSPIVSATYTFPTDVTDIAALRAQPFGSLYRVTGEITYTGGDGFRNTKYFQDASGFGIQIDDASGIIGTTYSVGDNIEGFVGTLGAFRNQLQWVPEFDPGAPVSTGNPVVPVVRTLDSLSSDDQALLIRINDVEFEDAGGLFGDGGQGTDITDPSVSGFVGRFRNNFGGSDITGAEIPSGTVDLIAIVQQRDDDFSVAVRSLADIIESSGPDGTPFEDFLDGFGELPPEDRAPGADPANDGVPNAAKFVYGGSPLVADRSVLPAGETVDDGDDQYFELTLSFAQAAAWNAATATFAGDGFTVVVKSSTDLDSFDPADMVAESGVVDGDVAADSTVVLRTVNPISGAEFFRTEIDVDTTGGE